MIGSSTAVTAIVTLVAMKPLLDRGYDKTLVIGTVTGSSLGLIIPPSVGFIVYGFLTDTSVGELFIGRGGARGHAGGPVQHLRGRQLQDHRQVPPGLLHLERNAWPPCASR